MPDVVQRITQALAQLDIAAGSLLHADWGSDVSAFLDAMKRKVTEVVRALGEGAIEGAQTAGRWIFGGLLLAGAIWGAVKLHETRTER